MKAKYPIGYLLLVLLTSCNDMGDAESPGSWKRLADFPGKSSVFGVTFSLQDKGYWASSNADGVLEEIWAYDPAVDSWEQKKNFPYDGRVAHSAAVVDGKAFVVSSDGLYEYNAVADDWTFRSSFPASNSGFLISFALGDNVYLGMGNIPDERNTNSFWKYNTTLNSWTQIDDVPGEARRNAISFVVGNNAYVGGGFNSDTAPPYLTDIYRYDGQTQTWQAVADLPDDSAVGLTVANDSRGYVGVLVNGSAQGAQIFEYHPEQDQWRRMSRFPSGQSLVAKSFFLNNRMFIVGSGFYLNANPEVWEFVP